jgi:hypothetical protein
MTETTIYKHMIGKTMKSVTGEKGDEDMCFVEEGGAVHKFWYEHDCCASCSIEDICGELSDLTGSPIIEATETVNGDDMPNIPAHWGSHTWTFYRFSTAKGTVTVRWFGESNGYYSESVSYKYRDSDGKRVEP